MEVSAVDKGGGNGLKLQEDKRSEMNRVNYFSIEKDPLKTIDTNHLNLPRLRISWIGVQSAFDWFYRLFKSPAIYRFIIFQFRFECF